MFIGYPILDAKSYDLIDYFERFFLELDEDLAHILIRPIGDPGQSGPIYEKLRTEELRQQDERDSAWYVETVVKAGKERNHRLRQMNLLRDHYGLAREDVPCVVFRTGVRTGRVGVFPILPGWYSRDGFADGVDECFRNGLRQESVRELATSSLDDSEISVRLGPILDAIVQQTSTGIAGSDQSRGGSPNHARPDGTSRVRLSHTALVAMPEGATWGDVSIRLRDTETVSIRVESSTRVYNYTQMGMANSTNGRPTRQWELLVAFAWARGEIGWKGPDADPALKKRKQVLSEQLKAAFGLDDDPIVWDKEAKAYRCRFRVVPLGDGDY